MSRRKLTLGKSARHLNIELATEQSSRKKTRPTIFEQTQVESKKKLCKKSFKFEVPPETTDNNTCTCNYNENYLQQKKTNP